MAKIVMYSMACRGDVFPYVPIASELSRRGHDVVFVVPREYHPLFASEPFRCVHSGTDFSAESWIGVTSWFAAGALLLGASVALLLPFSAWIIAAGLSWRSPQQE